VYKSQVLIQLIFIVTRVIEIFALLSRSVLLYLFNFFIHLMHYAYLCSRFNASQLIQPRRGGNVYPGTDARQKRDEMKNQYADWVRQLKGYTSSQHSFDWWYKFAKCIKDFVLGCCCLSDWKAIQPVKVLHQQSQRICGETFERPGVISGKSRSVKQKRNWQ